MQDVGSVPFGCDGHGEFYSLSAVQSLTLLILVRR